MRAERRLGGRRYFLLFLFLLHIGVVAAILYPRHPRFAIYPYVEDFARFSKVLKTLK